MPRQWLVAIKTRGNHPELEISECLDSDSIQKHQSIIGVIQWDVYLGRLDIDTAVMTLESFIAEPRQGHLDLYKRDTSYLDKCKWATIRISTEEPDLSSVSTNLCD